MSLRCLPIFLLAGACFGETFDDAALRLLPPDAAVLAGVEWRKLINAPSSEALRDRLQQTGISFPMLAELEKALREKVETILVAAPARAFSTAGPGTPILVIVKGRFDEGGEWMQGRSEWHRKIRLVAPKNMKPPTMRMARLDANWLLFGDRREVMAAIDRRAGSVSLRPSSGLLARAAEVAARSEVWLAMDVPAKGLPTGDRAEAQILSQLAGLEAGLSLSGGLRLEANLRAKSEPDAAALATTLQTLAAMEAQSQSPDSERGTLLRNLKLAREHSSVSLSISLSPSELTALSAGPPQTRAAAASSDARPAARPAAPAPPRKIRIVGLDQGLVEIPVR